MNENNQEKHKRQASQYLKYAVGEIVLVVLGILIALQINNWNESRKENKVLKEYLGKIKSHTLEDMQKLDTIAKYRTQTAETCKQARIRILDKTEDEDLILFMISGAAFADYYFKPNTGGYEALINSAYYGKINNTRLDSLLSRYHSLVDDIAENEKSYNDYMVHQESYLSTQFDRSLILASAFMSPQSLNERATPNRSTLKTSRHIHQLPPTEMSSTWRPSSLMHNGSSSINELKAVGQNVVLEIDGLIGK